MDRTPKISVISWSDATATDAMEVCGARRINEKYRTVCQYDCAYLQYVVQQLVDRVVRLQIHNEDVND